MPAAAAIQDVTSPGGIVIPAIGFGCKKSEWRSTMLERSLVLLKPDCVQRRLLGRVISRFEDKGLTILAMTGMYFLEKRANRGFVRSAS